MEWRSLKNKCGKGLYWLALLLVLMFPLLFLIGGIAVLLSPGPDIFPGGSEWGDVVIGLFLILFGGALGWAQVSDMITDARRGEMELEPVALREVHPHCWHRVGPHEMCCWCGRLQKDLHGYFQTLSEGEQFGFPSDPPTE